MKTTYRWIGVITAALLLGFTHPAPTSNLYSSQYENVLGTSMELKIQARSEREAASAEADALREISRLSGLLSSYDAQSEFSRWCATQHIPVRISPELYEVLDLFNHWRVRTRGALDISVGELSNLWQQAEEKQVLPDESSVARAVHTVQQPHYRLDSAGRMAIHLDHSPLVLNSFTKSYIIRKVASRIMDQPGVSAVVLNIGGDLLCLGGHAERVELRDPMASADNDPPLQQLQVSNRAVATSGNYQRGFWIRGKWYSHIIDPRNGMPANEILSATVLAPNATDAGALATALNVLTPQESLALVAATPGTACYIIDRSGRHYASDNWPGKALAKKRAKPVVRLPQDWNPNYELLVSLELTRFPNMTRRPFVAVWIEDAGHHPVRTLALWFNKPRWLPDLKQWYRSNYEKFNSTADGVFSISSATRPAGKYQLRWDGKNDEGQWVKSGTYTLFIEAAREHGTYQLIRQEIACTGKPVQIECEGNTEISAAHLDYRKKENGNGSN